MKKRVLSTILAAVMLLSVLSTVSFAASYTDTVNHWSVDNIDYWTADGSINGYSDNTFKPNNDITRGEFCQFIAKALGLEFTGDVSEFKDVGTDAWYFKAVNACAKAGIVLGYNDGTFKANEKINRQEAATMIARAINGTEKTASTDTVKKYNDSGKISTWALESIAVLVNIDVMSGYAADNTIKPTKDITRAETVKLLRSLDEAVTKAASAAASSGSTQSGTSEAAAPALSYGVGSRSAEQVNKCRAAVKETPIAETVTITVAEPVTETPAEEEKKTEEETKTEETKTEETKTEETTKTEDTTKTDSGSSSTGSSSSSTGSGSSSGSGSYTPTIRRYTITWKYKNADGSSNSDSTTEKVGSMPTHANPIDYTAGGVSYRFDGWTPAITSATSAATYTAHYHAYNANGYNLKIAISDGTKKLESNGTATAYGTSVLAQVLNAYNTTLGDGTLSTTFAGRDAAQQKAAELVGHYTDALLGTSAALTQWNADVDATTVVLTSATGRAAEEIKAMFKNNLNATYADLGEGTWNITLPNVGGYNYTVTITLTPIA